MGFQNPEHPKVAIYARVSTNDQSADTQLHTLRRFVLARGWRIAAEYVDQGISGAERDRPSLAALMLAARRRDFDICLVWKFDRFARSTAHLLEALETFRALGIDFISMTEGIDTTTPVGRMVFTIVGAIAQFERDLIGERVRAGMQAARDRGAPIGRPRRTLSESDLVLIRRRRAEAFTWFEIAHELKVSPAYLRKALTPQFRRRLGSELAAHGRLLSPLLDRLSTGE